MESVLHTIFYFIVAIGILVAFHEFGHFWVARKSGVKVLRFSIGFGKVVWRYQKSSQSTEYVISAIPLGGYVKMLDEREGPVEKEELPYAFNRQSLMIRTAIVLAGPLFNLLLAVLLFWGALMIGEKGIRPIIGPVEAGTLAAEAGFQEGQEIVEVNGKSTPTWSETMGTLFSTAASSNDQLIEIGVLDQNDFVIYKNLSISGDVTEEPEKFFEELGLVPWVPPLEPVIGKIVSGEPAEKAGIQTGDLIISADKQPIDSWMQWVEYVRSRADQKISVVVEREGHVLSFDITPSAMETDQGTYGRIGAAVMVPEGLMESLQVVYKLGPIDAFKEALERTWFYSTTTIKVLGSMLIGNASVENLSGPIGIAQLAGQTADLGVVPFLKFLGLISVSLGVLNLLPIPVLDGGHLMFYAVEAIKGSPVSEKLQIVFQQVGIALLMSLMMFAVFLDIERVIG